MIKSRHILAVCGLLLFVVSGVSAKEDLWVGGYRGSNIPGYQIDEMELIVSDYSGLQRQGLYEEMLDYMKTQCSRRHGVALVNVTLTPAIGDVRSPTSSGQSKIFSPGIHISGLADCVLKVEKTTR